VQNNQPHQPHPSFSHRRGHKRRRTIESQGVDIATSAPASRTSRTEHIQESRFKAIEENRTKYTATAAIMPLREAITAWQKRELRIRLTAKECVVTVGGKHYISTPSACLSKGDEVILHESYG